jgi:hypothetical protein
MPTSTKLPEEREAIYSEIRTHISSAYNSLDHARKELDAARAAELDEYSEPVPYDEEDRVTIDSTHDAFEEGISAWHMAMTKAKTALYVVEVAIASMVLEAEKLRKKSDAFDARWRS